mmetsp:Transcript_2777/g.2912  ORF Transcript_2777/g.2912 Transcript_2777/m.2912 type:complete len:358 (+) Transcript_2777:125-1198(+)
MAAITMNVIFILLIYMFIGPTLILLNKFILHNLSFPYPMFLSGLGVAVSGLVAQVIVRAGYVVLQRKDAVEGILWYKRILPVGLAHAGTLAFGNSVYLLLNVGFIQMLKSFTPVIIMIVGYLARIENPSRPVILSIMVISIGTATTCSFTPQLNLLGLLVMFLAEVTEAVRLVLTQFLLQNLKFGVVEGQYVIAPASAFWLFLASAIYEFPTMIKANAFSTIFANPMTFVAASTMGLGVNFMTYYVIQATSGLTMKVLGTVRNIFTIFLGFLFYKEVISVNEGLGYTIALLGFAAYNIAKSGYYDTLPLTREDKNDGLAKPTSAKGQSELYSPSDDIEALRKYDTGSSPPIRKQNKL